MPNKLYMKLKPKKHNIGNNIINFGSLKKNKNFFKWKTLFME